MPNTIFFSWQVDTASLGGRNLIEKALERAASRIGKDTSVEEAVRELAVDRDTKDVAGSPPIVDTIFSKIDQAAVLVPDLTFVGRRLDGRPTPNPNVLIEYGWALKSLTYSRIVPVMNTAFGEPTAQSMPFDLGHLRRPITYHCPDDLSETDRRQAREQLTKELEKAIRLVLKSQEYRDSLPKSPEPDKFLEKLAVDGRGRFKPADEPIGIDREFTQGPQEVFLSPNPACWFRLSPLNDPGRTWTVEVLEREMKAPIVPPLSRDWHGYNFLRATEGYGIYVGLGNERYIARAVAIAFTSGEIWTADTFWLEAYRQDEKKVVPSDERPFRDALVDYGGFLSRLGIDPPYQWTAGMENLKGRILYAPIRRGYTRVFNVPDGKCLDDVVTESGLYTPGEPPGKTLKPFFAKLYNSCGVQRADWRDE
jgi:hypothetical protein